MTDIERTFWLQEENSFRSQRVRAVLSDAAFFVVMMLAVAGGWLWGPKISVVLSESMKPTYTAGDALFVVPWGAPGIGDIAQFKVPLAAGQAETVAPVTHRIVGRDERGFITKGDNPQSTPDSWRVTPDMIEGTVLFWMPRVWMFRIASALLGVAILMFLWPKNDEAAEDLESPFGAANPSLVAAYPQPHFAVPQGPAVMLPRPQGMPVHLPPPAAYERGVV